MTYTLDVKEQSCPTSYLHSGRKFKKHGAQECRLLSVTGQVEPKLK